MNRRGFLAGLSFAPVAMAQGRSTAHPRLFVDAKRVAELRELIRGSHAAIWAQVLVIADKFARERPAPYRESKETNDEELWQREVGNRMPYVAFAYLMTGDRKYVDAASGWALMSCSYPHWGTGVRDGMDLAAGHQLFGLALVYDWLFDVLSPAVRDEIKRTLLKRGGAMYEAAAKGRVYWQRSYLQNHLWVNATGMFAAALALDGEPSTEAWISMVREKYRRTEAALGSDGASHEGVGYWDYGVEYMLKYWDLAGAAFGDRPSSVWWKRTAAYRQYFSLPRNVWTRAFSAVDIGDSPRSAWYGPDQMMRRLAALYRDGHAQYFAAEVEKAQVTVASASWLNVVWYDPTVVAQSPADLPTLRHFEDMGLVAARSSWSGDESMVVFKCGPALGHEATDKFDYDAGSGHVHPDANHFVIFGGGEFLIRDDGYAWKMTGQHNTLLIDGAGQIGEGSQWFRGGDVLKAKAHPRVLKAVSSADLDEMVGDATSIYPAALGLRKFVRRLLFVKPSALIVVDEIETDRARELELRFHPEFAFAKLADGAFLARGKKAALRMEVLTAEGVEVSSGVIATKERHGGEAGMETVALRATRAKWRNVVAFSWAAVGAEPARVKLEGGVVRVGGRRVEI